MDREPDAVRVESPFARPREPRILVAVAVTFLLLALLKPWSIAENGAAGQAPARSSTLSGPAQAIGALLSEPTPAPSSDPNAMDCLSDRTEQVVILERWAGNEVRSWIAAPEGGGPLGADSGPIAIFSSHVVGLGICSMKSEGGGQRPAARLLDVRSITASSDGPVVISLGVPHPITRGVGGPDAAVLYGAPAPILRRGSIGGGAVGAPAGQAATPSPRTTSTVTIQPPTPVTDLATWPNGSYELVFTFPSDDAGSVHGLLINLIHGAGSAG